MNDSESAICQCGCGESIPWSRGWKYNGVPRFLRGHFLRVYEPNTPQRARKPPDPALIPSGICECGCGGKTSISKTTVPSKRYFRGYPVPRMRGHSTQGSMETHHNWKGGVVRKSTGYLLQYAPDHPHADRKGYVLQHRLVAEQMLGRPLLGSETVHHVNHVKDDNRRENLRVMTKGAHNAEHAPERKYDSAKMRAVGLKGASARWGKTYT